MDTPVRDASTPPPGDPPEPDDPTEDPVVAASAGRTRRRRRSGAWLLGEWAILVGSALVIALLIKAFLFQAFYIPSESMLPTLQENDRVMVNKLSYRLHDVHRGDIVVFSAPAGEETGGINDLVKRVIGLAGEEIEGRDGHVYVDGRLLDEPYLADDVVTPAFGPEEVPAESVFVMGDNRASSRDSRKFGPVPESDVVGRAFVRMWPLDRIGFL